MYEENEIERIRKDIYKDMWEKKQRETDFSKKLDWEKKDES